VADRQTRTAQVPSSIFFGALTRGYFDIAKAYHTRCQIAGRLFHRLVFNFL